MEITVDGQKISNNGQTYFIADIAANHDGELSRAIDLIYMSAEAGANAAKFQHFEASSIVSDKTFQTFGSQLSHQRNWKKSVFEVYDAASVNRDWTPLLKEACDKAGITFFSTPYSFDLVDHIDQFVSVYKIGSGDITWLDFINFVSSKKKPVFLATGASTLLETKKACEIVLNHHSELVLMQCNTNYTASLENFKYINLNVLKKYREEYPNMILGLSDHTPGHTTTLGAVALGARVIEKHFTDNNHKEGPDHKFAMNPFSWKEMVDRTRELEFALGGKIKKVEQNELETVQVQRRSAHLVRPMSAGEQLQASDIEMLRPCPDDAFSPDRIHELVGKTLKSDKHGGQYIKESDIF